MTNSREKKYIFAGDEGKPLVAHIVKVAASGGEAESDDVTVRPLVEIPFGPLGLNRYMIIFKTKK